MSIQRIYHALPYGLKCLAASYHGHHLQRWRYGADTQQLVAEAHERERWPETRFQSWRAKQLADMLDHAATRVPFYRDYWSTKCTDKHAKPWLHLSNWPVLTKEAVRKDPHRFLADGIDPRTLFADHTSGTTGTPLHIWLDKHAVHAWYAVYEARIRNWWGVSVNDRWAILGGQAVAAPGRAKPPYWVWNSSMNQLYMSAMHIADWSASDYLRAMQRYEVRYLLGYTTSITKLGRANPAMASALKLSAVVANAEPVLPYQRTHIEEDWGCHLNETYGSSEAICGASQCTAGNLHLWDDVGVLEVLDDSGEPVLQGQPGRVVATGLLNMAMPLIRFDIRDRIQLAPPGVTCECGRRLPIVQRIWGRYDDVVITKDGRTLALLDRVFDPPLHIVEGQIVQEKIDKYVLRVVAAPLWSATDEQLLIQRFRDLVGDGHITVEQVDALPRTFAGKVRVIVSNVSGNHRSTSA